MNEIHVFDCDGVLIDSAHRYRNLSNGSIDLPYWIEHHTPDLVAKDSLLPTVERYRESLNNPGIYTVIATAREMLQSDFEYFKNVLHSPQHLISRKANDSRKDWKLKIAGMRRLLSLRQFKGKPVTLWEDNPVTIAAIKKVFPHWTFNYVQSLQGA